MNSLVFIKGILGTDKQPAIDDNGQLIPNGVVFLNPVDKRAIEAALQLAGDSGTVTVASYGEEDVTASALRAGLSMGAQQAITIKSDIQDAKVVPGIILAEAAHQLANYDVIFTGEEAVDDAQGTTGSLIADALKLPYYDNVDELTPVQSDQFAYKMKWSQGTVSGQLKLPAVISVDSTINKPRLPSFKTKIAAKRAQIDTIEISKLSLLTNDEWRQLTSSVGNQRIVRLPEQQPAKTIDYESNKTESIQTLVSAIKQQGVL